MMRLTTTADIELIPPGMDRDRMRHYGFVPVIYLSPAVIWFSNQMEQQLQKHKELGDKFKGASATDLLEELRKQIIDVGTDHRDARIKKAADVANYAMFIAINELISQGKAE